MKLFEHLVKIVFLLFTLYKKSQLASPSPGKKASTGGRFQFYLRLIFEKSLTQSKHCKATSTLDFHLFTFIPIKNHI